LSVRIFLLDDAKYVPCPGDSERVSGAYRTRSSPTAYDIGWPVIASKYVNPGDGFTSRQYHSSFGVCRKSIPARCREARRSMSGFWRILRMTW